MEKAKPEIKWWSDKTAFERYSLMRKNGLEEVSNKLIKRMFNNEDNLLNTQ